MRFDLQFQHHHLKLRFRFLAPAVVLVAAVSGADEIADAAARVSKWVCMEDRGTATRFPGSRVSVPPAMNSGMAVDRAPGCCHSENIQ